MTKGTIKKYEGMLLALQADLEKSLRFRDGIFIDKAPDIIDDTQSTSDRELASQTLVQNSDKLQLVRYALGRIKKETFGLCQICLTEIEYKRLNAVPWTACCIRCQMKSAEGEHPHFSVDNSRQPKMHVDRKNYPPPEDRRSVFDNYCVRYVQRSPPLA